MSGKAIRETLTALGVIASMVFVGMEIRQNTAAIRSETGQSVYTQYMDATGPLMENPELAEIIDVTP